VIPKTGVDQGAGLEDLLWFEFLAGETCSHRRRHSLLPNTRSRWLFEGRGGATQRIHLSSHQVAVQWPPGSNSGCNYNGIDSGGLKAMSLFGVSLLPGRIRESNACKLHQHERLLPVRSI